MPNTTKGKMPSTSRKPARTRVPVSAATTNITPKRVSLRQLLLNLKAHKRPVSVAMLFGKSEIMSISEIDRRLTQLEGSELGDSVEAKNLTIRLRAEMEEVSPLELHDRVLQGLPVSRLMQMLDNFSTVPRITLLKLLGLSERTMKRHRSGVLNIYIASAALDLASITEAAVRVLGSMPEAERWMMKGALALNGRRPIDLLSTHQGADLVRALLVRMEYGVYS